MTWTNNAEIEGLRNELDYSRIECEAADRVIKDLRIEIARLRQRIAELEDPYYLKGLLAENGRLQAGLQAITMELHIAKAALEAKP